VIRSRISKRTIPPPLSSTRISPRTSATSVACLDLQAELTLGINGCLSRREHDFDLSSIAGVLDEG